MVAVRETSADSTSPTARRLAIKKRPDLITARHKYLSHPYVVIKEPVGLKYFRFPEEEYAVLEMLDGRASLEEIKEAFDRRFAPQAIRITELQQFLGHLHKSGLVVADSDQARQLARRYEENRKQKLLATFSNIFAVRWKGIDPERLLSWFYPYSAWAFSRAAVIASLFLAAVALLLIVVQFDEFRSRLPAFSTFFGPANWIWLGLTLAAVKILHEFGHGLTCKKYGGECHQIGFMLLVFTPALYCDVSDSWMLRSKWQRAAIGAAGIYVEVTLAAIATFLWWFSERGLFNHICLSLMFVCSVSTLLFNGNPLLRFDGYYVLADILEMPNLAQRAQNVLRRLMFVHVLGIKMPADVFLPGRRKLMLAVYTAASFFYRWFVVLSIAWFLLKVLEPYGLAAVGWLLALGGLFGLIVQPLWRLAKFLYQPGRLHEVNKHRALIALAAITSLVAAILALPLPHYVYGPLEVRPRGATPIYLETGGVLEEVYARPGDTVEAGQAIARIENLTLRSEVADLEGQRLELEQQLLASRIGRRQDGGGRGVPEIEAEIARLDRQIEERRRQLDRLVIASPRSGTVLPGEPRRSPPRPEHALRTWRGLPTDPENVGAVLEKEQLLCYVGEPEQYEAVIYVDQAEVELIARGMPVTVQLESHPDSTFNGELEKLGRSQVTELPPALSIQAGGGVATETDESGHARPLSSTYQARVPLGQGTGPIPAATRGKAKIYTGWEPLGVRLWRAAVRTFRFEL